MAAGLFRVRDAAAISQPFRRAAAHDLIQGDQLPFQASRARRLGAGQQSQRPFLKPEPRRARFSLSGADCTEPGGGGDTRVVSSASKPGRKRSVSSARRTRMNLLWARRLCLLSQTLPSLIRCCCRALHWPPLASTGLNWPQPLPPSHPTSVILSLWKRSRSWFGFTSDSPFLSSGSPSQQRVSNDQARVGACRLSLPRTIHSRTGQNLLRHICRMQL